MFEDDILNTMDNFVKEKNKKKKKEETSIARETSYEFFKRKTEEWYKEKIKSIRDYMINKQKYPVDLVDLLITNDIKRLLEPNFGDNDEIETITINAYKNKNKETFFDDIKEGELPDKVKEAIIEELFESTTYIINQRNYLKFLKICKIKGANNEDIKFLAEKITTELRLLNNANNVLINTPDYHRDNYISIQKLLAVIIVLIDFYKKKIIKNIEPVYRLLLASLYYLDNSEIKSIINNEEINHFILEESPKVSFIFCIPNRDMFQKSNILFILKTLYKNNNPELVDFLIKIINNNSYEKEKKIMLLLIEDYKNIERSEKLTAIQDNLIKIIQYISNENNIIFGNNNTSTSYNYRKFSNELYTDFLITIMNQNIKNAERIIEYYIENTWPHILEDWLNVYKAIVNIMINKGYNTFKKLINKNKIIVNHMCDVFINNTQEAQKNIQKDELKLLIGFLLTYADEKEKNNLLIAAIENKTTFRKLNGNYWAKIE